MRKQRVDVLVHILVDQVELDLRREEVQVTLGFDAPRLQKHEKTARRLAYAVETGELESMIEHCEDGTDKVSPVHLFDLYTYATCPLIDPRHYGSILYT